MKTFDEQNKELIEFDKTFDPKNFNSCVTRAMLLLQNREAQMREEGHVWLFEMDKCRWAVEQNIINRAPGMSMLAAAIEHVESVERRAEQYNGIEDEYAN